MELNPSLLVLVRHKEDQKLAGILTHCCNSMDVEWALDTIIPDANEGDFEFAVLDSGLPLAFGISELGDAKNEFFGGSEVYFTLTELLNVLGLKWLPHVELPEGDDDD